MEDKLHHYLNHLTKEKKSCSNILFFEGSSILAHKVKILGFFFSNTSLLILIFEFKLNILNLLTNDVDIMNLYIV